MEAANTHLNSLSEIPKPTVIISVFTTDIHEHFAFRNLISLHIYLLNISYCQNTVGVLLFSSFVLYTKIRQNIKIKAGTKFRNNDNTTAHLSQGQDVRPIQNLLIIII